MKFLSPDIAWDSVCAIGFDMDGTLYDEFEFINQVYEPIALFIADKSSKNVVDIKNQMLQKWIEKGSSYPYIFSETIAANQIEGDIDAMVKHLLNIFRNYSPNLKLTTRAKFILECCSTQFKMFLVSDGSSKLQWEKFHSLGLDMYFKKENIFISGDYGAEYTKPSLFSLDKIEALKNISSEKVVFIGDREVDKNYASNAGFIFVDASRVKIY